MSLLVESYTEMMKGVGASSRVLDLIEQPPAVPARPAIVSSERFRGRIEFDKVTFAYAGTFVVVSDGLVSF